MANHRAGNISGYEGAALLVRNAQQWPAMPAVSSYAYHSGRNSEVLRVERSRDRTYLVFRSQ